MSSTMGVFLELWGEIVSLLIGTFVFGWLLGVVTSAWIEKPLGPWSPPVRLDEEEER